jgi:hypothetical protein
MWIRLKNQASRKSDKFGTFVDFEEFSLKRRALNQRLINPFAPTEIPIFQNM